MLYSHIAPSWFIMSIAVMSGLSRGTTCQPSFEIFLFMKMTDRVCFALASLCVEEYMMFHLELVVVRLTQFMASSCKAAMS